MLFHQLESFHHHPKMLETKTVSTPGLNDVLGAHEVTHGVNSLKHKFKKIFNDPKLSKQYFYSRPLNPEFASYSA